MTEGRERPDGTARRGAVGVLLVAPATFLGIGFADPYARGNPALQVILLLGAAAAAAVIATPVGVGLLMRVDRDKVGSAREIERQRFAAHLHDSVLQTLALVQRQAQDPVAVARLARRQEYALRAWMAGKAELISETVGAALRDAVAGVEDEYGITVELTAIGDRPLDSGAEALVAAVHEALRNAARHAAGAPVFVFAEMSAAGAEVFVRDEGPGFDAGGVLAERRGIRDAIIGRMRSAGGTATVESAAGEGTEVALRIGRAPPGREMSERRLRVVVRDDHHLFRAGVRAESCWPAATSSARPATLPRRSRRSSGRRRMWCCSTSTSATAGARRCARAADDGDPTGCPGPLGVRRRRGRGADDPRRCAWLCDQDHQHRRAARRHRTGCRRGRLLQSAAGGVRPPGVLRAQAADRPDASLHALTPREREVLHHLARGYSYKRIAARLEISARTVESHVGAVLRKLQLSSR